MINLIILLVLSLVAAFVLTLRSMGKYHGLSSNFSEEYGIYLIQDPARLTMQMLNHLHSMLYEAPRLKPWYRLSFTALVDRRFLLSFERLQKGKKRALVVFGPRVVLDPLSDQLQLVELEDYTQNIGWQNLTIWEVALRDLEVEQAKELINPKTQSLDQDEQLWWQIVIQPKRNGTSFYCVIRVAVVSTNKPKAEAIKLEFIKKGSSAGFRVLTTVHSPTQKLDFYRQRALPISAPVQSTASAEILRLLIGL